MRHGLTRVTAVHSIGDRQQQQATCSCGWQSPPLPDRDAARRAHSEHKHDARHVRAA